MKHQKQPPKWVDINILGIWKLHTTDDTKVKRWFVMAIAVQIVIVLGLLAWLVWLVML